MKRGGYISKVVNYLTIIFSALSILLCSYLVYDINQKEKELQQITDRMERLEDDLLKIRMEVDILNQKLDAIEKKMEEVNEIYETIKSKSEFSNEEIKYLHKCIETETYGQDFNSKVNVANVLLNRINNEKFPNDAISVVTQKNQFAYGRNNISEDTKEALQYAMNNADTTDGAIGFNSFDKVKHKWNNWKYVMTDKCGHHFYKFA